MLWLIGELINFWKSKLPFGVRHGVADGLHRKNREFAHGAIAPIFFSPHAARMLTRAADGRGQFTGQVGSYNFSEWERIS